MGFSFTRRQIRHRRRLRVNLVSSLSDGGEAVNQNSLRREPDLEALIGHPMRTREKFVPFGTAVESVTLRREAVADLSEILLHSL